MSSNSVIPAERASGAGNASEQRSSLIAQIPGAVAGQSTDRQPDTRVPAGGPNDDVMLPSRGNPHAARVPDSAGVWSPPAVRPPWTRWFDAVQTLVWAVTASMPSRGNPHGARVPDSAGVWSPPAVRPPWTRWFDAVQTLVWAVTASSAAILVGALPLACSLLAFSPYAFLPTMGVILAASVGMWAATQLGTAAAIYYARRDARPHANMVAVGQSERQHACAAAQNELAETGAQSAASSMLTLLDEAAATHNLSVTPAPAVPAATAHAAGRPADFRSELLPRLDMVERGHGNMRQYLPTAPHASAPQPYVTLTRNVRNRHDFLQLLQSDGSGFNIIGLHGNPSSYDLWVWTVLDGLLVLTGNRVSMRWGGQWLTGLFVGAWNGFAMLGGETGFAHAGWWLGLRTNGNVNRSYHRSESIERNTPAQLTAAAADVESEAKAEPDAEPSQGEAPALGALLHTDASTQGVGFANNFAARFWRGRAELFARRDVARQAHHTLKRRVDEGAAAQALANERARTNVRGWLLGWVNPNLFFDGRVDSEQLVPLAKANQSVEQGLERTTQYLWAIGQPSHRRTAAGTFIGRHTAHHHGRSLMLEPLPADDPQTLRVTFKDRHLQSRRDLLGFTSGMGFDRGKGKVAESEWGIEVGLDDVQAHAAIVALDRAMLRAHRAEKEFDESAVLALEAAQGQLRAHHRARPGDTESMQWHNVRSGHHNGYDVGARVPVVGSEAWSRRAPKGFAWSALSQRRDLHMDEHKTIITTSPTGHVQEANKQIAWAGRVVHASGFGPLGTRNTSLWAQVSDNGVRQKRSVLFETVWQMSRGNQYDYRDYVLQPLNDAFGITLPQADHGDWRVQRTVRLSRAFAHDDPWLRDDAQLDESESLWPLQQSLRAFFERLDAPVPPVDAPAVCDAPANNVRNAFSDLFAGQSMAALPMLVQALGAKQCGTPSAPDGAHGPPPPPKEEPPRQPSAVTLVASPARAALGRWQVTVTSDALEQPNNGLVAYGLRPPNERTVAQCDTQLEHTDAAVMLAAREPLCSRAVRVAHARALAQTHDAWQAHRGQAVRAAASQAS